MKLLVRAVDQVARNPPSIGRANPLNIAAASLSRKQTTDAISAHSANRPNGIRLSIGPPLSGSLHARLPISVNTTVGLTELTLIPNLPSSTAITLVNWSRPAFDAQ